MRIAMFGATGRVGRLVLAEALARGHSVTALVRAPSALGAHVGLQVVIGDVTDPEAVASAIGGADVVVDTLGPRRNSADQVALFETAIGNIVAGMERQGVRRLIALSGAGIDAPGDRKPLFDRIATRMVRLFSPHVRGAKQREFDVFSSADIDWTAVRPPLVHDGPRTGRVHADPTTLKAGARIGRSDLAAFIIDQVGDPTYIKMAPFIWS